MTVKRTTAKRRPRGTRIDPVACGWAIEREKKTRLEEIAERAGVSAAVYLERVIDHVDQELGDDGLPTWWPAPEEELPIDKAS